MNQEEEASRFFEDLGNVTPRPPAVEDEPIKDKPDDTKPKEEESPIFQRDKKKKGATPEESLGILRKQRDEEREKNKRLSSIFGESDPDAVKPIFDLIIEKANGPVTKEFIEEFLSSYKDSENKINLLAKELEEKEKKVSEIDIRYSDDFKASFEKPYGDALQSLYLEFANLDGDKVIAPNSTKAFNEYLTGEAELNGIEVKSALFKFAKAFREESGEEPILPSVTDLMKSIREFNSKRDGLKDAYTNWKTKKKEIEESRARENEETSATQSKAMKRKRVELASKAFQEFESPDFIEDDDVSKMFSEEFKFGEDLREGKDVPTYDKILQRGVKSRLWDLYKDELAELRQFKASHEKGERNGLTKNDRFPEKDKVTGKYGADYYL
jgi:hypothetical protein